MEIKISFFKGPIWNKAPMKVVSLFWVWMYVTMKYLQFGYDPDRHVDLESRTNTNQGKRMKSY